MIVEYIRYTIPVEKRQEFIEEYANASKQLDDSEYCLGYELTECEEEAGSFILRIEWTSTDEHLHGFRKSTLFSTFYAHVKPFFNNIQEMRHYQLTDIQRKKQKKDA